MFDVKNDLRTYKNIWKNATSQGDNYKTGCLLDYNYFKEHYKLIAIDLSKQQALDDVPKALQQIYFTANLERTESTAMFFIIEKVKKSILDFSQETVKILWIDFTLI